MTIMPLESAKSYMIHGIDVGHHTLKDVFSYGGNIQQDSFLSTVKKGINSLSNKGIGIIYEGEKFTIGSVAGEPTEELNKLQDKDFKLLLLTAIAKNLPSNDGEVSIVTGLPANFYDSQKTKLRKLFENTNHEITILKGEKEIKKNIYIKNVRAFPQCSGIFLLHPELLEGRHIIIDMGGKTIDISVYVDGEVLLQNTITLGALDIYKKIQGQLESDPKYAVSYSKMECENIVRTKKGIIRGVETDLTDLVNPIIKDFAIEALGKLEDNIPEYNSCIRHFIGGTALTIKEYLPVGHHLIEDVFFNARIFHDIAVDKFGR